MKVVKIELEACEPLVLTDGSAESMSHQTLEYIPGNKILGAMVGKWIQLHKKDAGVPDDNEEFRGLFLDGSVEWGHALPMAGGEPTVPVPLSYRKIKNHGGLPLAGGSTSDCRVFNIATIGTVEAQKGKLGFGPSDEVGERNLMSELLSKEGLIDSGAIFKPKKLSSGFMTEKGWEPEIKKGFDMHVAIGDDRKAADGLLFGYSSIAAGTRFLTEVRVNDPRLEEALRQLLGSLSSFNVGHSRSAGYGKVEICNQKMIWMDEQDSVHFVPKHSPGMKNGACGGWLYLESGYIPKHGWQTPIQALENEIREKSGVDGIDFHFDLNEIYSQSEPLESFNSLLRLPRSERKVLKAGSVLKFTCSSSFKLMRSYGGWRAEGYGRVQAADGFSPSFITDIKPVDANASPVGIAKPTSTKRADPKSFQVTGFLNAWKARSLHRLAMQAADEFVAEGGAHFLEGYELRCRNKMTPSQLGNLRVMLTTSEHHLWADLFEQMLKRDNKKTNNKSIWDKCTAWSPFDNSKADVEVSEIIKDMLSPRQGQFSEFADSKFSGPRFAALRLDGNDRKKFVSELRLLSLFGLIKIWEAQIKMDAARARRDAGGKNEEDR